MLRAGFSDENLTENTHETALPRRQKKEVRVNMNDPATHTHAHTHRHEEEKYIQWASAPFQRGAFSEYFTAMPQRTHESN